MVYEFPRDYTSQSAPISVEERVVTPIESNGSLVIVPDSLNPSPRSDQKPQDPQADNLPQAGGWLPSDVASIVRLLEKLYALELQQAQARRLYVDQFVNLQANYEADGFPLDARPYGFTQVAVYIANGNPAAGATILLRRGGMADVSVIVPAAHFVTLQQPMDTRVLLSGASGQVGAIFRYSDQVFGTILP